MADSFISDLNTATNMFTQGVQQLAVSNGISQAQQQIDDINKSQMNEIDKRNKLQQVAQGLSLNLVKSGAPATTVEQAFGAIAPAAIGNANQANIQALLKGSPELANVATTQQTFEEQPKLAALKQQNANDIAMQKLRNQGAVEAAGTKAGASETKEQNKAFQSAQQLLESARGNPAAAQAEKDLYAAKKVDSLANLYGDPSKLSQSQVNLLSQEVGKLAAGGVPTMHELDGISPNTLTGRMSKYVSQLTNNPTPANAAEFVKQFQDYTGALKEDAQKTIEDKYGRIIESRKKQLGPENYDALKSQYLDRFKQPDNAAAPGNGQAAAAQAPSAPLQTVTLKDGRRVRGRFLPNGQFQME